MKNAPVLLAFAALLLSGCGQPPSVAALAADPARLHALRAHDGAFCTQVAQADLRRFLSGQAGPDEYQTLADLPPIPPSFDEPADGGAAVALLGQEASP